MTLQKTVETTECRELNHRSGELNLTKHSSLRFVPSPEVRASLNLQPVEVAPKENPNGKCGLQGEGLADRQS